MSEFLSFDGERFGYYSVGSLRFTDRLAAEAAASGGEKVTFHYYDHLWDSYSRKHLGVVPIDDWYKARAVQLRDKYDHLILLYSGGADSHQILRTFVDNNIKLDEIHVQWFTHWMDSSRFVPKWDTNPENFYSEWHLSIKPTLDWLRSKRPEIKITVTDPLDALHTLKAEDLLDPVVLASQFVPQIRRADPINAVIWGQHRNTGVMIGAEKPLLFRQGYLINFLFTDGLFSAATGHRNTENSTMECFFTQVDVPQVPIEMAFLVAKHAREHPEFLAYLPSYNDVDYAERERKNKVYHRVVNSIIYPKSFTAAKFQANKSANDCSDWYADIVQDSQVQQFRNQYQGALREKYSSMKQTSVLRPSDYMTIKSIPTQLFPLLHL